MENSTWFIGECIGYREEFKLYERPICFLCMREMLRKTFPTSLDSMLKPSPFPVRIKIMNGVFAGSRLAFPLSTHGASE